MGSLNGPSAKVAEVEPDTTGAARGNIASLTDVIQRNPNDPTAYNTRGIAYAKIGQYQNAIEDFTKAIQLDPHFSGAYTNRALAFRQIGKDGPALADFNQAIAANPERRRRLSRARQSAARAGQIPGSARRSQRGDPASIPKARRPITRAD